LLLFLFFYIYIFIFYFFLFAMSGLVLYQTKLKQLKLHRATVQAQKEREQQERERILREAAEANAKSKKSSLASASSGNAAKARAEALKRFKEQQQLVKQHAESQQAATGGAEAGAASAQGSTTGTTLSSTGSSTVQTSINMTSGIDTTTTDSSIGHSEDYTSSTSSKQKRAVKRKRTHMSTPAFSEFIEPAPTHHQEPEEEMPLSSGYIPPAAPRFVTATDTKFHVGVQPTTKRRAVEYEGISRRAGLGSYGSSSANADRGIDDTSANNNNSGSKHSKHGRHSSYDGNANVMQMPDPSKHFSTRFPWRVEPGDLDRTWGWSYQMANPHMAQFFVGPERDMQVDDPVFSRSLTDGFPQLPYRRRKDELKSVVHWPQRKLLMFELEFLTSHMVDDCIVVYAGAAPGMHLAYLVDMFPTVKKFVFVDTKHIACAPSDRVEIRQEPFTDEMAQSFVGSEVLFICDVQSSNNPDTDNPWVDMEAQQRWHEIMQPIRSLLRFQLPYTKDVSEFLGGDILFPLWGSATGTEARIIPTAGIRNYDHTVYEQRMFYFNTVTRVQGYTHQVKAEGIDHCFDCASEIEILRAYIERFHEDYLDSKPGALSPVQAITKARKQRVGDDSKGMGYGLKSTNAAATADTVSAGDDDSKASSAAIHEQAKANVVVETVKQTHPSALAAPMHVENDIKDDSMSDSAHSGAGVDTDMASSTADAQAAEHSDTGDDTSGFSYGFGASGDAAAVAAAASSSSSSSSPATAVVAAASSVPMGASTESFDDLLQNFKRTKEQDAQDPTHLTGLNDHPFPSSYPTDAASMARLPRLLSAVSELSVATSRHISTFRTLETVLPPPHKRAVTRLAQSQRRELQAAQDAV
jgi:Poly A polymerase regulatory subunit